MCDYGACTAATGVMSSAIPSPVPQPPRFHGNYSPSDCFPFEQ